MSDALSLLMLFVAGTVVGAIGGELIYRLLEGSW
jgi:F0F1-type ATP synthase assembly protein I